METVSYKCINCGGPLQYNAEKQKFYCEFCRSEFTDEELKKHFGALDEKLETTESVSEEKADDVPEGFEDFASNTVMYTCQSCGAEIIADKTTAATFCVYCHNPVVLSNRLTGAFKPDKVIPFIISEEEAQQRFFDFCGKKHFLPKNFISDAQLDMMKGVYYPYWLVDSLKDGNLFATAEKRRTWTEGDYEYQINDNGTVTITKYIGESLTVTIPSKIANTTVESIGNNAIAFVGTSGVQLGWLASQADMLAEDWKIVE